jgi:hypothetical protein
LTPNKNPSSSSSILVRVEARNNKCGAEITRDESEIVIPRDG